MVQMNAAIEGIMAQHSRSAEQQVPGAFSPFSRWHWEVDSPGRIWMTGFRSPTARMRALISSDSSRAPDVFLPKKQRETRRFRWLKSIESIKDGIGRTPRRYP